MIARHWLPGIGRPELDFNFRQDRAIRTGDLEFGNGELLFSKLVESGYPLYSSGEPSYPWTRAVGGEDRGN